jgi:hypothetical protein
MYYEWALQSRTLGKETYRKWKMGMEQNKQV